MNMILKVRLVNYPKCLTVLTGNICIWLMALCFLPWCNQGDKWSSVNWGSIEFGIWPRRPLCFFLSSLFSCLSPCGQNNHKNSPVFCRKTWPGFHIIPVCTWINPKLTSGTAGYSWPSEFKYDLCWNIWLTRLVGKWVVLFNWTLSVKNKFCNYCFHFHLFYWIFLKCITQLCCH